MKVFTLAKTEEIQATPKKKETAYTYVCGAETVTFHSHPTKAWNFVILENKTEKKNTLSKIVDQWIEQGSKQHDYKGGFDEAIKVLEIK